MPTIYATHGMTGSGKSTFAKKFCVENKVLRLAHDEIMITLYGSNPPQEKFAEYFQGVNELLKKLAKDLLANNNDVFLDLGMFKRSDRDFWRNFAKENNAEFKMFFIDCPREVALERTLNRTEQMPDGAFFIDENGFNVINDRIESLDDDEEYERISGV
ncbi:MAG: ATP-binding protein [Alphaproteobacteria bacterium]|jgi:predicted kinase|nr:ATP-binding protein [Alphaproteobacteria bacterium]